MPITPRGSSYPSSSMASSSHGSAPALKNSQVGSSHELRLSTTSPRELDAGQIPIFGREAEIQESSIPIKPRELLIEECVEHFKQGLKEGEAFLNKLTPLCLTSLLGLKALPANEDEKDLYIQAAVVNYSRNQSGQAPLVAAALRGEADTVYRLLQLPGINPNVTNRHGDSPLSAAALAGHTAVVEILLGIPEINIQITNRYGDSPLSSAALGGHAAVVEALLRAPGIDVNAVSRSGNTALIEAALTGHTAVVEILLRAPGIDVNVVNRDGNTALMEAALRGHDAVIEALLKIEGVDRRRGLKAQSSEGIQMDCSLLASIASAFCFNYASVENLLRDPALRAEYNAIILGNFISLERIALPPGVSHSSLLWRIFRTGGGYSGLSLFYLIEAWHAFEKLRFKAEYERFDAPMKEASEKVIASWTRIDYAESQGLAQRIKNDEPCSWTVNVPGHTMGMSVSGDQLIFSNLGGALDLSTVF